MEYDDICEKCWNESDELDDNLICMNCHFDTIDFMEDEYE